MAKTGLPTSPKVILPLVGLFLVILLVMPRSGKFNYDYRKGYPWTYDALVAKVDFPVLKTAEQLKTEKDAAEALVVPYFRFSDEVTVSALRAVETAAMEDDMKRAVIASASAIFTKGIVDDADLPQGDVIFVQKDRMAVKMPAAEVFTVTSARARLLSELSAARPSPKLDSLLSACRIYDQVLPNLIYDKETTELVHEEAVNHISPTQGFVNAGQLIVSKGEVVTAEIQQMLDSYKAEYESSLGYNGPGWLMWLGNALIALSLVIILYLSLWYTNPAVFEDTKRFLYLLFIILLPVTGAVLVDKFNPELLYMIPFSLAVLYLMAFFRKRVVLPTYIISLLPLLVFAHNGIELFVMYMVAGVITMYVFMHFNRGWLQFVTALVGFVCLALTYLGFRLINGIHTVESINILYLFLASMLSVAGYPLIYLFEKIFGLVSDSRLQELCDTNDNELISELAMKAPGTFQHSLQVMNMSEAAARSIDANVLLVRAGALYHDIGKIMNPQCFIENESLGARYHDGLSPKESAADIIRHVADGLAIADKYKIPVVVKDFIRTHHGTTCTGYFYNKYINDGGDPDNASAFYYTGGRPTTKEQIVVMLCDTLEAASRTLKSNTPETFDRFVESIVDSKMKDGQFDEADISLAEVSTVKSVLKTYLRQIYHDRVEYPKRNR